MNNIKDYIKTNILNMMMLAKDEHFQDVYSVIIKTLVDCIKSGGHIYLAGNGGSYADALHIAGELNGKIYQDRQPYPAHVLGSDGASLTAIANDYSYDQIFARELQGKMTENDVFIGISTSGNSKNIVEAMKIAKGITILLTGSNNACKASEHCAIMLNVPGSRADEIQTLHQIIYHSLIYDIEEKLK